MDKDFRSIDMFGVRIDMVSLDSAVNIIGGWLKKGRNYYVVTPNVEFLIASLGDSEFKKVLNKADLAIPDSSRFSWAEESLEEKSLLKRILFTPFVLAPPIIFKNRIPVTTGTDLVEALCVYAAKRGVRVGFLGGKNGVADKASKRLVEKYPGLKVSFAESGPLVDNKGEEVGGQSRAISKLPETDILFVAFGQIKQEKWIAKNLEKIPAKVSIGVGGALDYFSGDVIRAPSLLRNLGLEWLFRLLIQPWRLKRQVNLLRFIWTIVFKKVGF
ncbi:MAG: WecB/TagA/CpsF family glycosyltransferase [Candidatus Daviesbacteria bacterium]|nr:WecB/TagA/CpsF family glycosyltransferase [Candidatus Daviesbacteria bacterium]